MELTLPLAILLFIAGIVLVLYFAEKLVEATVGTSLHFGLSIFLVSVVFIGFDPENLAVGSVAAAEEVAGFALGSVFGSAMVAIALAFGITALISPMKFEEAPKEILFIPLIATMLLGACSLDGVLSRTDGVFLIGGYISAVFFLGYLSRKGLEIRPAGELEESLEKDDEMTGSKAIGWFILSLASIVAGSELLVTGAAFMLSYWNLSDTVYGMTVLAFIISIEELARELPAALKGRAEIAYGNVVGSILAFFLFNAGIIAFVHPVPVNELVLTFYLPISLGTVLFVTFIMIWNAIPRWAGAVLTGTYLLFFITGYL